MTTMRTKALAMFVAVGVSSSTAWAGSHLWRFNEMFTNADGTIQFVEMKECCGSNIETVLQGKWVSSDATGSTYIFPNNIPTGTANKYLLLGTAAFAALPGAPTPDFIIPSNFLPTNGAPDTLRYWMYGDAILPIPGGLIPTNGVLSLNQNGTTGTNSPTNYAGQSGSVVAGPPTPAVSTWGVVALTLLMLISATIVLVGRKDSSLANLS